MNTSKEYVKDVISFFVKSDFGEEKAFIEEQKKAGIKVCDKIITEKQNGEDSLKIVTQLSIQNDKSDLDKCGDNNMASSFFISSLTVTSDDENRTNITTVVGKRDSNLEAVYKASVAQQRVGSKLVLHSSYLRPARNANLSQTFSSFNKPETIQEVEASDNAKTNKKSKIAKMFSFKKGKDKKVPEGVSNQSISSTSNSDEIVRASATSKRPIKLIDLKKKLPIKSFVIGTDPGIFKGAISKNKERSMSMSRPKYTPTKVSKVTETTTDVNTTSITTTINKSKDPEMFNAIIGNAINDSDPWIRMSQEHLAPALKDMHIDIIPEIKNRLRRGSAPNLTCDCKQQKLNLITECLKKILEKRPVDEVEKHFSLLDDFDPSTYHRRTCPCHDILECRWRQSYDTLNVHCDSCQNLNVLMNPSLRKSMESLVNFMDDDSGTDISQGDIDKLQKIVNYNHFEMCVRKILGTRPTPFNFSRLLSITRMVVRQIGDPYDSGDKHIDRIYQFVVKFYVSHFYPHLKEHHNSLEDFLINCQCDNFEDVQ